VKQNVYSEKSTNSNGRSIDADLRIDSQDIAIAFK
jgi:hypothetical protein